VISFPVLILQVIEHSIKNHWVIARGRGITLFSSEIID